MTFDKFLAEHRLTLIGMYLLQSRWEVQPALSAPCPPATMADRDVEHLIADLKRLMPPDNMISDLWDWDLQLHDLMADDWIFGAAFGPESLVDAHASDLATVFIEKVDELGLDYNQHADRDSFETLVEAEALRFVEAWWRRIIDSTR